MIKVNMIGINNQPPTSEVGNLPIGPFVGKLGTDEEDHLYLATGGRVVQLDTRSGNLMVFSEACKVVTWWPVSLEITVKVKGD